MTQADVVAFLSRPGTLAAEAPEIVETHASIVFLTGERAYKLKRDIRYSYLDYSTPERRRTACETELELNRAFAPSLYLGVEPIVRDRDGTLRLGGEGQALDWLVVMVQFNPAAQLDRMAERGALTDELARALADEIAERHRAGAARPDHGGSAGLASAMDGIITNLGIEAETILAPAAVDAWTERARQALATHTALLDRRRADGKVRACHSDLHLRNICVLDGHPTLFDAIEFDPALSSIDVLYDLAFLLMDLHGRGLERFANLVFNQYLDANDETDGLALLPLFMSVRAAIRAEVSATAARMSADVQTRRTAASDARRYLDLARELLEPHAPVLLAIGGLSGTGKSTLAYHLAPRLGRAPGARVLRSDVLRKRLAGVPPNSRLPPRFYTPEARQAVYAALAQETARCFGTGHAVIADAVFDRPGERILLETPGVPFRGHWLTAPIDTLRRRVASRGADASDATVDVVDRQGAEDHPVPDGWIGIDAGGTADQVAHRASPFLWTDRR